MSTIATENYLKTIKDELMKMRGALHAMTADELCMFTQSGILRIARDGSCKGFYWPWYHKKINKDDMMSPHYFGGDDIWILTNTAILRLDLNTPLKELSLETGYNISGAWDIEVFEDTSFFSSSQGFRRWNTTTSDFEFMDDNTPDFESGNILRAYGKLILSNWIELGVYEKGTYEVVLRDGAYSTFFRRSRFRLLLGGKR